MAICSSKTDASDITPGIGVLSSHNLEASDEVELATLSQALLEDERLRAIVLREGRPLYTVWENDSGTIYSHYQ